VEEEAGSQKVSIGEVDEDNKEEYGGGVEIDGEGSEEEGGDSEVGKEAAE
jgi:hypothetical protein